MHVERLGPLSISGVSTAHEGEVSCKTSWISQNFRPKVIAIEPQVQGYERWTNSKFCTNFVGGHVKTPLTRHCRVERGGESSIRCNCRVAQNWYLMHQKPFSRKFPALLVKEIAWEAIWGGQIEMMDYCTWLIWGSIVCRILSVVMSYTGI